MIGLFYSLDIVFSLDTLLNARNAQITEMPFVFSRSSQMRWKDDLSLQPSRTLFCSPLSILGLESFLLNNRCSTSPRKTGDIISCWKEMLNYQMFVWQADSSVGMGRLPLSPAMIAMIYSRSSKLPLFHWIKRWYMEYRNSRSIDFLCRKDKFNPGFL